VLFRNHAHGDRPARRSDRPLGVLNGKQISHGQSAQRVFFLLAIRVTDSDWATRLPAIQRSLQPPLTARPFEIGLRGLGAFPDRGRPRVIWAGLDRGRDDLTALAGELTARLGSTGVPVDDRPHQPHLTLARVRDAGGLRTSTLFAGLEQVALGTMEVRAITLFESRLSPAGAIYQPLVKSHLGAARNESSV